jgi:IclR family transcriptional regulator, KDG regulon repressor
LLPDYTVAALEDAISILDLLQNYREGAPLAELTRASGMVKNKVFRLLFTLEKHHLVERDEHGRYRLGLHILEYAQHVQIQTTLLEASRPVMDWLVEETRESIFLGVVSGSDALCVAARESPRSVRLYAEIGRRATLHSGGVPKVLFAFLPEQERTVLLDRYFAGESAESGIAANRQVFEERLAHIREQGYAIVIDELDAGAHSVAAPIRDYRGQVVAAISIAGPSDRFTEECIPRYVQLALEAAGQISQALGYAVREPGMRRNGQLTTI